jgi:protein-disulfide isomerase
VGERDHARGSASAAVTLIEYGDFQCPYCGAAYPVVKEVLASCADRLRLVYRHFPVTNVHPLAQASAEAAEWADSQGAFWAFHDRLYEQEGDLSGERLLELASDLRLDHGSLARALERHTFLPRVKQDFLDALHAGVKGTPAFFLNGVRHHGAWDTATLTAAIDHAALSARAAGPPDPAPPAPGGAPPR